MDSFITAKPLFYFGIDTLNRRTFFESVNTEVNTGPGFGNSAYVTSSFEFDSNSRASPTKTGGWRKKKVYYGFLPLWCMDKVH